MNAPNDGDQENTIVDRTAVHVIQVYQDYLCLVGFVTSLRLLQEPA